MEQVIWAAFSLVAFFVAVDKESNSPVGATKFDRIKFERVLLRGPKGKAHGCAAYYPLPRYITTY
jgi:hypothetical protein